MRFSLKDGRSVTITITSQNNQPKIEVALSPSLSGKSSKRLVTTPVEPTVIVEVKEEKVEHE